MVAIDNAQDIPARGQTGFTGYVLLLTVLGAGLIVAASLSMNTAAGNGWHVAAEMVSRFSLLVFAVAMLVEPLSRLIPSQVTRMVGRERGSLMLAFAVVSAVGLACVAAPTELSGQPMTLEAVAYSALTALILLVLLASAHPATMRFLGGPAWRTLQRVATAYFWLVFFLTGIEHLIGPHLPDRWYGFSVLLLVGVLLVRFADALVEHWRRPRLAGKVA
ncbi:MAG TPA: hypothetical protein VHZ78_15780 [Rhizomicrobium sp.]|jgi:hypothetical protein|nr:hypothetical protein [Rhizomicrobium sp.]